MDSKCNFLLLLVIIGLSTSLASIASNDIPVEQKSSAQTKCESSYSLMCLKMDILSLIDKLSTSAKEFNLATGVTLVREENPNKAQTSKIVAELARAFPDSPEQRLNGFLVAKIQDLLQSFSLKVKLLPEDANGVFESRKGGGGGGLGGKKGGGMLAMALMMKGGMFAMAMAGVAALAGKALMTGMMAATLAGIVGLKSLTSKDDKKTTYEIISKPVYSHSHSHSTGGHGGGGHGGSHEESHAGYGYGRSFTNNFQLPESVKK